MTSRPALNVAVVGDSGVGKTSLVRQFVDSERFDVCGEPLKRQFISVASGKYLASVSVDGEVMDLEICNASKLELLGHSFNVLIVVFSVDKPGSFENILKRRFLELSHDRHNAAILLVGNKIDLRNNPKTLKDLSESGEHPITTQMGEQLALKLRAFNYLDCSMFDQVKIEKVFEETVWASFREKKLKNHIIKRIEKFSRDKTRIKMKISVVGHSMVGKTSFINQFLYGKPCMNYPYRHGSDFDIARFSVNDFECFLQIWETNGYERYAEYRRYHYKGNDAVIIVLDVRRSFSKYWLKEALEYFPNIPSMLVLNKTDLRTDIESCVTTKMGEQFAKQLNAAKYVECSCKDGSEIEGVYEDVALLSYLCHEEKDRPKSFVFSFNIALIGDSDVGISHLIRQFLFHERLNRVGQRLNGPCYIPNVADSISTCIDVDGEEYFLKIYNLSFPEFHNKFISNTLRNADAIVAVYSVNKIQSYRNIAVKWFPELRRNRRNAPIVLVGNNTDVTITAVNFLTFKKGLSKAKQLITREKGKELAYFLKATKFFECSFFEGNEIENIFEEAVWSLLRRAEEERHKAIQLQKENERKARSPFDFLRSIFSR